MQIGFARRRLYSIVWKNLVILLGKILLNIVRCVCYVICGFEAMGWAGWVIGKIGYLGANCEFASWICSESLLSEKLARNMDSSYDGGAIFSKINEILWIRVFMTFYSLEQEGKNQYSRKFGSRYHDICELADSSACGADGWAGALLLGIFWGSVNISGTVPITIGIFPSKFTCSDDTHASTYARCWL